MVRTHSLGFPRIGPRRELKFALEAYWRGEGSAADLEATARLLREQNWQRQIDLDWLPVGDFSFYDQVLDTSFLLGNVPERAKRSESDESAADFEQYFRLARGRAHHDDAHCTHAGEMTKWFDTNYHYIVPELNQHTEFSLNSQRLIAQIEHAVESGVNCKPVIIGPLTYLWLSKARDESDRLALLSTLIPVYQQLLRELAERDIEWVQVDEPLLVTELDSQWQDAFRAAYEILASRNVPRPKILLTTYFDRLAEQLELACALPIDGLHIDAINAREDVERAVDLLNPEQILSVGIINGRNIWKTDLNAALDWLEPIHRKRPENLWLAPSCSLLHVPVDLRSETKLWNEESDVANWLAFAQQKLDELQLLKTALTNGRVSVAQTLKDNADALSQRSRSKRVVNPEVRTALATVTDDMAKRHSPYEERVQIQRKHLGLPLLPTTTIGSFPQTAEIRQARLDLKKGELGQAEYEQCMRDEIRAAVRHQENLGLDVLVHGEAERNDMVEYFGEQLEGFIFSRFGWVQSYGSRCVKPPILFGDVSRPNAMTVHWAEYARSLSERPMKGMLTGPVTILNWSFVRDDQPRELSCRQLALAVRDEVLDLEHAGLPIIQIDEAALREGLPLRKSQWQEYLRWAVDCFRLCANGVDDQTQIHTHMCYSEFNDIMPAIAAMDADVITIETSRSNMELLDAFETFDYPNEIGPGVYDIHSPNIPTESQIVELIQKAAKRIPTERLWINPDCGLKTRTWDDVLPALKTLVGAAKALRQDL